jgi:hypothetical protein
VLLVAVVAPLWFWHGMLADLASNPRAGLTQVVGELGPWLLMMAGVLFLIPVALSAGRSPESRLYPRSRHAYLGWGIVLYLLGTLMAVQVAALASPP